VSTSDVASKGKPFGSLEQLCASKEIIISTGSGGVGKTTIAAALGATAAANLGIKVLVLTIDPARRLASALGLEQFGNVETQVPVSAFVDAGASPQGELWVAMLDTKQSWDDLIQTHAPDAATRDAILANPLYRNITGKFIQSHDYVAMERLYQIHTSGKYDLIVVDTPPTRNAIDFLDAPERMAEFFSSKLLRWLIAPYQSRMVGFASKPFYLVADRILGTQFLEDIAEFFILFQSMYAGFVERAQAVTALLGSQQTSFLVVSTLESSPAQEAEFFLKVLADRDYQVGALILNKVLPGYFLSRAGADSARALTAQPREVAAKLHEVNPELSEDHLANMLGEIGSSFLNYQVVARRESEQRAALSGSADVTLSIPYFEQDIHSLSALLRLGEKIWS
jgi:anion-transporting  ArsA/GET3 family ATPase